MEIEKLYVSLFLDSEDYTAGLRDAQREGALWSQRMRESIGGGIQTAGRIATGALLGIGAAAVGAFALAGSAAISMNSTLETSTLQFTTLMGDADLAKEHVAGLFEFAKATPFETGPIIEASRMMQTFGGASLNTEANLRLVGDAAAAVDAPINELGFWVGRLYANLQAGQPFGEAAARLQELAVMSPQARLQMEELQAAGGDASDVFAIFQDDLGKFTGAMESQAGTWSGLQSTISDALNITMATALRPFFDMAKEGLGWLAEFLSSDTVTEGAAAFAAVIGDIGGAVQLFATALQDGQTPVQAFTLAWGTLGMELGISTATIQAVRESVLGFVNQVMVIAEPILTWVRNNIELNDVLIALAIVSVVVAAAPILLAFGLLVGAVALVRTAWEENWGGIQEKTAAAWATIQPLLQAARDWLSVNVPQALETLRAWWVDVAWPAISTALTNAWFIISTIWNALTTFITGTLIPTLLTLYAEWSAKWTLIQTVVQNVWEVVSEVWTEIGRWINENLGPWAVYLQEVWETGWTAIREAIDAAWVKIEPVWIIIQNWLEVVIPGAVRGMRDAWEFAMADVNSAIEPVKAAIDGIKSAAESFWNWISNHVFNFEFNLPDLPDWAVPGSPLPIHTAWANFARDMNQMTITPRVDLSGVAAVGGAALGGSSTYQYQSQTTVQLSPGQDPLRALRASRHLDKLAVAA